MQGAANKVQFHVITAGSPDTIITTPTLACTAIIQTTVGGLVAKIQTTWDFEIDQCDDTLLTALKALVGSTLPADEQTVNYENGTVSTNANVTSSSGIVRSVMVKYGTDLSATLMHVAVASGFVTQESWKHTTKWGDATKPALQYKTQKQASGNAITLAAGLWDATIVETTSPTPALPTSIAAASYGDDYALQKA